MILPDQDSALHRSHLNRLLTAIVDNDYLRPRVMFKGGTAATMLDYLDRFSVDLDFDLVPEVSLDKVRASLEAIAEKLGYPIKDHSRVAIQYLLGYNNRPKRRNTVKVEMIGTVIDGATYEIKYLPEIDRQVKVQTLDTMVASKLATPLDRWAKHHVVAGRDIYDIRHFMLNGYPVNEDVIRSKTGRSFLDYLPELIKFIETNVTQEAIDQDLNTLLDPATFKRIRLDIKDEALLFLRVHKKSLSDEFKRVESKKIEQLRQ